MPVGLLILGIYTIGFTMLAKRISTSMLTAPMLLILLGYILAEADLFPQAQAKKIMLATVIGIVFGVLGGKMLLLAKKHEMTSQIYEGIGVLALAGTAFLAAALIGANGFIRNPPVMTSDMAAQNCRPIRRALWRHTLKLN